MPEASIDVEYVVIYKCISVVWRYVDCGGYQRLCYRPVYDKLTGGSVYRTQVLLMLELKTKGLPAIPTLQQLSGIRHIIKETRYSMLEYFIETAWLKLTLGIVTEDYTSHVT